MCVYTLVVFLSGIIDTRRFMRITMEKSCVFAYIHDQLKRLELCFNVYNSLASPDTPTSILLSYYLHNKSSINMKLYIILLLSYVLDHQ